MKARLAVVALALCVAGCGEDTSGSSGAGAFAGAWEGTWFVSGPQGSANGEWFVSIDAGGSVEVSDSEGQFAMFGSIDSDGLIDISCPAVSEAFEKGCLGWYLSPDEVRGASGVLLLVAGQISGDLEVRDNWGTDYGTLSVSVSPR